MFFVVFFLTTCFEFDNSPKVEGIKGLSFSLLPFFSLLFLLASSVSPHPSFNSIYIQSIMGGILSFLFPSQPIRTLMLGLDAAGKTTVLYKLKLGEVVQSIPTIGFNVEEISFQNLKMSVWDV